MCVVWVLSGIFVDMDGMSIAREKQKIGNEKTKQNTNIANGNGKEAAGSSNSTVRNKTVNRRLPFALFYFLIIKENLKEKNVHCKHL